MPPTIEELGIDRMSRQDRVALAEAVLESIARETEAEPLSSAQRSELERRLDDCDANAGDLLPWKAIKADPLARVAK